MTNRNRLFAVLDGEPADRVPIWLLFPYHPIGCYVNVRTHPSYRPVFEASKKYAIMLNRRNLPVSVHTPEVTRWQEDVVVDGRQATRTYVAYRGERIYSQTCPDDNGRYSKKLLDSAADLEFYCSLPVETDPGRITAELDRRLPGYLRDKDAFPGEYGAMMLALGEPVGKLYGISNLEEYAIWSLTHDGVIVDFLDRMMVQYEMVYRYCLERDLADVYFLVGSELASPPLVSRRTFQRWIVPYARRLIDLVHGSGRHVIQHYHGQIKEILPDFLTMGADGLHTIEAPPVGNCTHTEAYEIVGDRITLIGNIQYEDFRAFSPKEMAVAVRDTLDECTGKRFIISPTAGPFDAHVPNEIIQNYIVFMETAWEYGKQF